MTTTSMIEKAGAHDVRRTVVGWAPGVLLLLVLAHLLIWPVHGDHALFYLAAERLRDGGTYYRDFWDVKQPGLTWFYAAGLGLGVGEVGPRLLELAVDVVAALALRRWLLRRTGDVRIAWWVVLLTFAPYAGWAFLDGASQPEGLVTALLVLQVVLLYDAPPGARTRPRWALAGALAGWSLLLKAAFAPVLLALVVGAVWANRGSPAQRGLPGWYAVGVAAPLALAVADAAAHGVLGVAVYTNLILPFHVLGTGGTRPGQWVTRLAGHGMAVAMPALGTFIAAWLVVRLGAPVHRHPARLLPRTPLTAALLVGAASWAVVGGLQGPAPYRFLLLSALLGLLAVEPVGVLVDAVVPGAKDPRATPRPAAAAVTRRVVAVCAFMLVFLPVVRADRVMLTTARDAPFSWRLEHNDAFAEQLYGLPVSGQAEPVRHLIRPGEEIYVLGDARLYRALRARQAIAVMGHASLLTGDAVFREMSRQLHCARPAYVFVDDIAHDVLIDRVPELVRFLGEGYRPIARVEARGHSPGGTWHASTGAWGPPVRGCTTAGSPWLGL